MCCVCVILQYSRHSKTTCKWSNNVLTYTYCVVLLAITNIYLTNIDKIFWELIMFLLLLQKINSKNAFGLHLIEFMADLLQSKKGEMTNFQVSQQLFVFLWKRGCMYSTYETVRTLKVCRFFDRCIFQNPSDWETVS